MSRTIKSRCWGRHQYVSDSGRLQFYKKSGNRAFRHKAKQMINSNVIDDDFEERLPDRMSDVFNWWDVY